MDDFAAYAAFLGECDEFVEDFLCFFLGVAVQVDIGNDGIVSVFQALDVVFSLSVFAEAGGWVVVCAAYVEVVFFVGAVVFGTGFDGGFVGLRIILLPVFNGETCPTACEKSKSYSCFCLFFSASCFSAASFLACLPSCLRIFWKSVFIFFPVICPMAVSGGVLICRMFAKRGEDDFVAVVCFLKV